MNPFPLTTEKLFYEDSYATQFTATVLSCEPQNDRYIAILNRTLFYPEGGGQPADKGKLGDAQVLDVHEKNGIIQHTLDAPVPIGQIIAGEIDWAYRLMLMQNHSGEHIVSGFINRLFQLSNVGFHMGTEFITIDLNGELSAEDLQTVEHKANEIVYQNIPIQAKLYTPEALTAVSYRSKIQLTEDVRLVEIPGADTCACCGLHCKATGEIGLIKIINAQHYKGGMRLFMLCGSRALADYRQKNKSVYAISAALSAKPHEVSQGVIKMLEENAACKQQLSICKKELFALKASELTRQERAAAAVAMESMLDQLVVFEEVLTSHDAKNYCTALSEHVILAAVFYREGPGKDVYKYALGSKTINVAEIGKRLNAALNGRGGGQAALVQGSVTATKEAIKQFFNELSKRHE